MFRRGACRRSGQRLGATPLAGASGRAARTNPAGTGTGVNIADAVFGGVVTGYALRAAGGIQPAPEGGVAARPRVMRPAESQGVSFVSGLTMLSSREVAADRELRANARSVFPSALLLTGRARRNSFLTSLWARGARRGRAFRSIASSVALLILPRRLPLEMSPSRPHSITGRAHGSIRLATARPAPITTIKQLNGTGEQ